MKDVCTLNQNITDKFKHLDDEQYQQEYAEHCRKMDIIDSYEDEIKEVLFLSSGCVDTSSHSYKEYGLGISPNYINLKSLIDKLQYLRATKLGLEYNTLGIFGGGDFEVYNDIVKHSLNFTTGSRDDEYKDCVVAVVNKYSTDFYNKEYFLGVKSDSYDNFETLISKDETWKQEYLRNPDTFKTPLEFTLATLLPVFGWLYILYSMYEAVKIYLKHRGVTK